MNKKFLLIVAGVLLLFIITNPGIASFKAFVGSNTYAGLHRTGQFFVCSTYTESGYDRPPRNYFGIVGNFFKIESPKPKPLSADQIQRMSDSSKMADSAALSAADTSKKVWTPPSTDKPIN